MKGQLNHEVNAGEEFVARAMTPSPLQLLNASG